MTATALAARSWRRRPTRNPFLRPRALLAALVVAASGTQVLPGGDRDPGGAPAGEAPRPAATASDRVRSTFARLPLRFEVNEGQVHPAVKFVARGPGSSLFLTAGEAVLALPGPAPAGGAAPGPDPWGPAEATEPGAVLRLSLAGAEPRPEVVGVDRLPGVSNYLRGDDPARWRTNVAGYAGVAYRGAYAGIDLVYHGRNDRLEYDFVVAPGADPGVIAVALDGHRGLRLEGDGSLVADMGSREVRQPRPVAYQVVGGTRLPVTAAYRLDRSGRVGFALGAHDPSRALVIDPVIEYSTYLGGTGYDLGRAVAVDAAGSAYVAGNTFSADFPTAGSLQAYAGAESGYDPIWGGDAFVAKLDPTGSALVYATYLGGAGDDGADDIALDASGQAFVLGATNSGDFPTTDGALQPDASGCDSPVPGATPCDVFVTKLAPSGDRPVYSTLLGGDNAELAGGIAVGDDGRAYLAGATVSTDFPTTVGAYDRTCGSSGLCDPVGTTDLAWDAFVAVLDAGGSALTYGTYLGGARTLANLRKEQVTDVAVDPNGHIFVTGYTESALFPTTPGATQLVCGSCQGDAFISRLDPAGQGALDLVYSSYVGGRVYPQGGESIALWSDGSNDQTYAYVAGWTWSLDFPTTPNAFQPRKTDPLYVDGFLVRVVTTAPLLGPTDYSTYIGGFDRDLAYGVAVDQAGAAYVTGETSANDFPTTVGGLERSKSGGGPAAFLLRIDPALVGSASLAYGTYLSRGEGFDEAGQGVAVDADADVFIAGYTSNFAFPVSAGAFQRGLRGPGGGDRRPDAFVTKLNFSGVYTRRADLSAAVSDSPDPVGVGQELTYAVTVTNAGPGPAADVVVTDQLPAGVTYRSSLGNCTHSAGTVTCRLASLGAGESFQPSITVTPDRAGTLTNAVSVRTSSEDPEVTNDSASTTTTVRPAADLSLTITDSPDPVRVRQRLTYTLAVANRGPSGATGVTVTQVLPAGVNFVSASASQGSCTRSKQQVTCSIGALAKDGASTVTVVVKPGDSGTIGTIASVAGDDVDPADADNSASASTTVTA